MKFFQVGTKVDDYWEPGKALLQDPAKFLESLFISLIRYAQEPGRSKLGYH